MKVQFLSLEIIISVLLVVVFADDLLNHLSTRTPYRFVNNPNDTEITYPGCKVKKIWMLIRHGTRFPSLKDVIAMHAKLTKIRQDILLRHKKKKGLLNPTDVTMLQKWTFSLKKEEAKILAEEGQEEMSLLAKRMQKRFPKLIKNTFDNNTFLFRFTATERAEESAKHFSQGLFIDSNIAHIWYPEAKSFDPILRFYKHCDKWKQEVKKNPNTYNEQKAFGISQVMNQTLKSIARRIGFDSVDLGMANLMYKMCGFEVSWFKNSTSPWCSVFDLQDVKVLEYFHDLKHYWMDSYGNELNYKQACLPVKDMFTQFQEKRRPKASFLFAHSGTVLKTLAHMGLNKPEEHLNSTFMDDQRLWRASRIDCFASNLAFVLFDCRIKDFVLTLHQESPVVLPMCKNFLCPMSLLLKHFKRSIDNCNFDEMCSLRREKDEL